MGLLGLMHWHMRCQWFLTQGRLKDAYDSRMKTIELLLPTGSEGILAKKEGGKVLRWDVWRVLKARGVKVAVPGA